MTTTDETPAGEPIVAPKPTVTETSSAWEARIGLFAKAVSKTPEEITNSLTPLVGEAGQDALDIVSDPTVILNSDLQTALVDGLKIPLGVFRKNLATLRGPQKTIVASAASAGDALVSLDVLPSVPEDSSFLEMLKIGGVLKPAKTEVIAAIKAALAYMLGLYNLPEIIIAKMETFAEEQDEPAPEAYYTLRRLVVSRSYADVLSVLGIEGSFVTESRKKAFLAKLDANLWDEIHGFYDRLSSWQDTWMKGVSNPAMALTMLAMGSSGARGIMPPGMMQPPETDSVRSAAEEVINKINKVFSGVGVPIARALAYDATRIKAMLEQPSLPASIGATNREQMLKMLGTTVGSDYVRLENSLARFVLAVMELPNVPSGNEELVYLGAMMQLGASIPWDKIPGGSASPGRAGIGRSRL
jgi:hypothetical protein